MKKKTLISAFLAFMTVNMFAQNPSTWNAPSSASAVKNPLQFTEENISEGKKIYLCTCAPCHGDKGRGDGIAAVACNPKPANHTSPTVQKETDGSIFWKITTGHGQMISYKSILAEEQRWKLVLFIRTLAKK